MQVNMARRCCESSRICDKWQLAVVGSALDDRGKKAIDCVKGSAERIITLRYDAHGMTLSLNGDRVECDEIAAALGDTQGQHILLEATTLGFPEILLCCRALISAETRLSLMYLEPGIYNAPRRLVEVLARRDFELSESVLEFQGIPGAIGTLDETRDQMVVFLVGYEGARLDRAVEDLPIRPARCHIVFGVPAFQAGWEMDSFSDAFATRPLRKGLSIRPAKKSFLDSN